MCAWPMMRANHKTSFSHLRMNIHFSENQSLHHHTQTSDERIHFDYCEYKGGLGRGGLGRGGAREGRG